MEMIMTTKTKGNQGSPMTPPLLISYLENTTFYVVSFYLF